MAPCLLGWSPLGSAFRLAGSGAQPSPARTLTRHCVARARPSLAASHCALCLSQVTCSSWHLGVFELLEHQAGAVQSPVLVPSTSHWLTASLCGVEGEKRCCPGAAPVETGIAEIGSCPRILRIPLCFCYLLRIRVFS